MIPMSKVAGRAWVILAAVTIVSCGWGATEKTEWKTVLNALESASPRAEMMGLDLGEPRDLCVGRITDEEPRPVTRCWVLDTKDAVECVRAPHPNECGYDYYFGTRFCRATASNPAAPDGRDFKKTLYAEVQPWTRDHKYLVVYNGTGTRYTLYDGNPPHEFVRPLALSGNPTDIEHLWPDPKVFVVTDPDLGNREVPVLWYTNNYNNVRDLRVVFVDYPSVGIDTDVPVSNFDDVCAPGPWGVGHATQQMLGAARLVGLQCGPNGAQKGVWSATEALSGGSKDNTLGWLYNEGLGPRAVPVPTMSETRAYLDGGWVLRFPPRTTPLEDRVFEVERFIPLGVNPFEHNQVAWSPARNADMFITAQYDPLPNDGAAALAVYQLDSGERTEIIGQQSWGGEYPASGTHVSATGPPPWVAVGSVGYDGTRSEGLLQGELALANIDTGAVCRVGRTRSDAGAHTCPPCYGYWAEPQCALCPDGGHVVCSADWFGHERALAGDDVSVDVYVYDLTAAAWWCDYVDCSATENVALTMSRPLDLAYLLPLE